MLPAINTGQNQQNVSATLNTDTVRTDIPTSATVTNMLVWNVEQSGTDDFTVSYEVDQQVKEGAINNKMLPLKNMYF